MNYADQCFATPIHIGTEQGYAIINAEMYAEEDGLEASGNYHVYVLHPGIGTLTFRLEPLKGVLMPMGNSLHLDPEVLQQVRAAISEWGSSDILRAYRQDDVFIIRERGESGYAVAFPATYQLLLQPGSSDEQDTEWHFDPELANTLGLAIENKEM